MAVIEVSFDDENDLINFIVIGEASLGDMLDVIEKYYPDREFKKVIWNLQDGTVKRLTGADLLQLAQRVKAVSCPSASAKTAIVTASAIDFGLARMYETMIENENIQIGYYVFKSLAMAKYWLYSTE
jgi:hypothetical protein